MRAGGLGSSSTLELHVNTFGGYLQLATLDNLDCLLGLVSRLGLGILDLLNDVVALEDLTEDDVAAIEPSARCKR